MPILDEIRPELNICLLIAVKAAIAHLKTRVKIPSVTDEGDDFSIYIVQQAAVDFTLFTKFAKTRHTMINTDVFSEAAGKKAEYKLSEAKKEYDHDHGKGASDDLFLFGD